MSRKIRNKLMPHSQSRTLVALLICFTTGLGIENVVQAQNASRQTPTKRQAVEETVSTAPQVASPNAEYALSAVRSRPTDSNDTSDTSIEVNDALARRLWQSRIAAPDPSEDLEIRQDLQHLIRQVRSMTFDDPTAEPTFSPPTPPAARNEAPIVPEIDSLTSAEPIPSTTTTAEAPVEPAQSLPVDTLDGLEDLVADPNQVDAPLEMAELLFLSGRATEAAVFYEKALTQFPANDLTTSEDRAWILFQLGNCLRGTDMAKARDMYMKLISQYPTSPWTELAKAHGRLINWYQSAKPDQLLSQSP